MMLHARVYNRRVRGTLLLVALAACTPARVENPHARAPRPVGGEVERDPTASVAPAAVVQTRDGKPFDLATLWQDHKVVVVFYQGGWCPHCKKQLAELQQHYRDFADAQATVVGISNEPGADATTLRDELGLGFELYSDPDLAVITRWGVENFGAGTARSATFVIQPGGAISFRQVADSPADHASIDELVAALR